MLLGSKTQCQKGLTQLNKNNFLKIEYFKNTSLWIHQTIKNKILLRNTILVLPFTSTLSDCVVIFSIEARYLLNHHPLALPYLPVTIQYKSLLTSAATCWKCVILKTFFELTYLHPLCHFLVLFGNTFLPLHIFRKEISSVPPIPIS